VLVSKSRFTNAEAHLGDEDIHLCTEAAPDSFFKNHVSHHELLLSRSVSSIRKMLQCFEAKFAEKLAKQSKRRAIWSVDIQCDEACKEALILGVSFEPASNVDYNQAFEYLFFDENSDLIQL